MSQIQVTNEITEQLTRLRTATAESVDFNLARQLSFENNQHFEALTEFRNIIRTIGTLSSRYEGVLEGDIRACEQVVENLRTLDQKVAQEMKG